MLVAPGVTVIVGITPDTVTGVDATPVELLYNEELLASGVYDALNV